jgi:cyclic pyranopterin monophosphate synthase
MNWRRIQIRRFCLSHVNPATNTPTMVNVGNKEVTLRIAHARCFVEFPQNVMKTLMKQNNEMVSKKGPVFTTAIIGGVMAAKKTSDLIPFCHLIALDDCEIKIDFDEEKVNTIRIDCIVKTSSKTGVEMEAFIGASNAALCVYDMCKAVSHDIKITDLQLISKTGGKRNFSRSE